MDKKIKINKKSIFLLGVFSSFQLVTLFGVTIFSFLLLFVCLINIKQMKKIVIRRGVFLLFLVSVTFTEILIGFENYDKSWIIESYKNYFLLVLTVFVYIVIKNLPLQYWNAFFRGMYYSCIIQVIWCYIQFFLYKILRLDLNRIVFTEMLHISGSVSQYKNGILSLTGLTCNTGILVPIFIVGIVITDNIFLKIAIIILAGMAGGSTIIIGIGSCVLLNIFVKIKKKKTISVKSIICALFLLVVLLIIGSNSLGVLEHILEKLLYSYQRILGIWNNIFIDGSTAVHLRYYTSIPYILSNIDIKNILFGYGLGCSGMPFEIFFKQYLGSIWIPESDFVSFLFDVGIIGVLIFYVFLINIIIKGYKVDVKYFIIMLSIVISGFFYNMQMNWMILFELLIYEAIRKKYSVQYLIKAKCKK